MVLPTVSQTGQPAADAFAHNLLGTAQILGDVRVLAVVDDPRPHRLLLIGRKPLDELQRRAAQRLDALDGLVGQHQRGRPNAPPSASLDPTPPLAHGEGVTGDAE
jgi:hypothetical protein